MHHCIINYTITQVIVVQFERVVWVVKCCVMSSSRMCSYSSIQEKFSFKNKTAYICKYFESIWIFKQLLFAVFLGKLRNVLYYSKLTLTVNWQRPRQFLCFINHPDSIAILLKLFILIEIIIINELMINIFIKLQNIGIRGISFFARFFLCQLL